MADRIWHILKNFQVPPVHGELSKDRAAEILLSAVNVSAPANYESKVLDQPVDGQIVIVNIAEGKPVPNDGWGWMDDEVYSTTVVKSGKELLMYTRRQGFAYGAKVANMTRTRYKLVGIPNLNLLHYCKVPDDAPKIPVMPEQVKIEPSSVQAQRASSSEPKNKKRKQTPSKPAPAPLVKHVAEEDPDAARNEDDGSSSLHTAISLNRYRRNHEYLEELFSPVVKVDLVDQPLDSFMSNYLDEGRVRGLLEEIEEMKAAHEKRMKRSWKDVP
ncbi:hypothetical protein HDU76_011188 [Blyttiomyces sp. JEL0837]|nr:hypothetical protein HDU76_011188 [Blyttiomyces sp. JEL0837]